MVASSHNYPYFSRVTTIQTALFCCMVSTVKDGFFERQSTIVLEMASPDSVKPRRGVARFIYTPAMGSLERLKLHDLFVKTLDRAGQTSSLSTAIGVASEVFRNNGVVSDVVDLRANSVRYKSSWNFASAR